MRLILFFIFAIITFISCDKNTPIDTNTNAGKPIVKILSPTNNSEISSVVPIQVETSDDKGIVKVEIYIDGIIRKEIRVPPYLYNWDTQVEQDSTLHLIYAKAYDADDNVSSSIVINVIVRKYASPMNLNYNLISDELLNLNWSYSNPSNFSFIVEEAVNNSNFYQILETNAGVTATQISKIFYTDSLYRYRVIAKKGNIYSSPSSNQIIHIEIPKPENFSAGILDSNSVKLVWSDVCSFESGYVLEKMEENSAYINVANLLPNTIEFMDNTYDNSKITTYLIKTITNHNESNPITATVFSSKPCKFTISGSGFNNRTFTFSSDSLVATVYGYYDPTDSLTVIWMYQFFAPDTIWFYFTFKGTGLGNPSDITMWLYHNSKYFIGSSDFQGSVTAVNVTKYGGIGGLIEGTFSGTLINPFVTGDNVTISNGQFSVVRRIIDAQIEKVQRDKIPIEIRKKYNIK